MHCALTRSICSPSGPPPSYVASLCMSVWDGCVLGAQRAQKTHCVFTNPGSLNQEPRVETNETIGAGMRPQEMFLQNKTDSARRNLETRTLASVAGSTEERQGRAFAEPTRRSLTPPPKPQNRNPSRRDSSIKILLPELQKRPTRLFFIT